MEATLIALNTDTLAEGLFF